MQFVLCAMVDTHKNEFRIFVVVILCIEYECVWSTAHAYLKLYKHENHSIPMAHGY